MRTGMQQRAGATRTKLLGGLTAKKRGRSRPIRAFLRGDFLRGGRCKRLKTNCTGRASGEELGNSESAEGNSYRLHLVHPFPTHASSKNSATHAGKTSEESPRGLERPQASLWPRNRVQKWGRSSPTRCFARVQIDRRAMRNLVFFGHLLDGQGDREGDAYRDLSVGVP